MLHIQLLRYLGTIINRENKKWDYTKDYTNADIEPHFGMISFRFVSPGQANYKVRIPTTHHVKLVVKGERKDEYIKDGRIERQDTQGYEGSIYDWRIRTKYLWISNKESATGEIPPVPFNEDYYNFFSGILDCRVKGFTVSPEPFKYYHRPIIPDDVSGKKGVDREWSEKIFDKEAYVEIRYSLTLCDIPTRELKADFTFSGLERGAIRLDGSHSTGEVKEYKWSFQLQEGTTLEEGVQFDPGVELTGKEREVVLLQPVEVTLTVSDRENKDQMTKVVAIKARDPKNWTTHCKHDDKLAELPGEFNPEDFPFGPKTKLGENVCAECLEAGEIEKWNRDNHYFHPGKKGIGTTNPTWHKTGFEVEKVTEGPFLGTYYVKEYKLRMSRRIWINPNYDENSIFFKKNIEKNTNVKIFKAALLYHEWLHTELPRQIVSKNDPGIEVEKCFSDTEDDLILKVNLIIDEISDKLLDLHGIIYPRVGAKYPGRGSSGFSL